MKYVIKNNDYTLSTKYEMAAEKVLGYGGVWTKNKDDFKVFNNRTEALKELNIMQRFGCGRDAKIVPFK